MFNKDTLRLIKRTKRRFLTLFLIVLIGVAFMVGVMSSSLVLRSSVDMYDDEYNLMDVQVYSSYGFCDEDVNALSKMAGIKDVFGTKFIDVKTSGKKDTQYVTRIQELNSNINKYELTSGRLPKKQNEALALEVGSFGSFYSIGDKVKISLDEDNEIEDRLKNLEYEIVGMVKTPQYMTSTSETSTLDNLPLDTVVYVDNSNFKSEYYTSIYLTFENSQDKIAFSDGYKEYIDDMLVGLDRFKQRQEPYLKNQIILDATKEIEDGEKELIEKTKEAQEKIDGAQKELDDAYIQLMVAQMQIDTNKTKIDAGLKEIETNQAILDSNANTLNDAIKEIEKQNGSSFDETYQKISALYSTYISLENQNNDTKIELQISKNKETIKTKEELIKNNKAKIDDLLSQESNEEIVLEIEKLQKENIEIKAEIVVLQELNNTLESMMENDSIKELLKKMDEEVGNGGVKEVYLNLTKLKEAKVKLDEGYQKLNEAKVEIESGQKELINAQKTVDESRMKYDSGIKDLAISKNELNDEIEKAQNELNKARQDLEELPDASWTILSRDEHFSSYMFKNTIKQMTNIGLIFPLFFFLVAALVCLTTMTRLIDEERSQLGIFSALGFSKNKIISKYLIYALLASLSGSLFGLLIGKYTFPVVIYEAWRLMYNLPVMHNYIPFSYALIGTLSFSILMMAVTYYVAHRELKEVPASLMRPKAPKKIKATFIEKIPFLWRNLSFTSKITARNLIRYKSRFLMTVIGVAGCTGLLVAGFGIKDSIADIIEIQYGEVFDYTNTINLKDDHNLDEIKNKLNSDSNNEQVVSFMEYSSKVYLDESDKVITVEVFDDRQIDRVMNLRERISKNKLDIHDGVIISEKFASSNNIKVGDSIVIESENGIKASVMVDGICEMYFQHYLFMNNDLYQDIFNENVHHDKIAVKSNDSELLNNMLKDNESVLSIVDFKPMIDNFENMIDALDIIIIAIILAAGSLAFVVLMNLSEVNISERLREIATLKVLGFNNHEVDTYIFKEIILLTIIGALIGLPIGKIEHHTIMSVINMDMIMYGTNIRLISYGYAFAITMIFTILVLLVMSKSLRKIEMVESLKSVE